MKIEKSNSENNQENKPRSLAKKLSFLWVILGAVLVHILINKTVLEDGNKFSAILIVWLIALAVSFNMVIYQFNKRYKDAWNDFSIAKSDITLEGKKTDERINLEKVGNISYAEIEKVSILTVARRVNYCMLTYSFLDTNGNKITKIKKYDDQGLQNIPKVGDKIKIIYDESNPNNSVIFHEEVTTKVKWYQLQQKKFTITVINNTNN